MYGDPIEIELSSADVTTAASVAIRTAGESTARVLATNERIVVTNLVATIASGATLVTLFSDANGGGTVDALERMAVLGEGTHSIDLGAGMSGAKGILPKVIAAGAGQVSITGSGYLINS